MSHTYLILGGSSDLAQAFMKEVDSPDNHFICQYNKNDSFLKKSQQTLNAKVSAFSCDLSESKNVLSFLDQLNNYIDEIDHVLFLAAGPFNYIHFKKINIEDVEKDMQIQLFSSMIILQALLPSLAKKECGRILFLLSSVVDEPISYLSGYTSVKMACLGLMQSLANEYQKKNIIFSALSPSMIDTKFLEKIPELVVEAAKNQISDGSLLSVSDVAIKMREHFQYTKDKSGTHEIWIKR